MSSPSPIFTMAMTPTDLCNIENINELSFSRQMCVIARMAASALFKSPDDEEPVDELEIAQDDTETTTTIPLSIPKPPQMELSDIALTDMAMSVDTVASSSEIHTAASSVSSTVSSEDDLPIYAMNEVKDHYETSDAWTIIYDRVYDVTKFLNEHPGGAYVMQDYLGYDATLAFRSVGHSTDAMTMLDKYLIGILPKNERLYEHRLRW